MANQTADQGTHSAIIALLSQQKPLSGAQLIQLQENLSETGHFSGKTFANLGPKTAKAITEFLKDNPDAITETNPHVLRKIMERGHTRTLQKIAQNTPGFDERIRAQLESMGALENPHEALKNSTDHQAVYALQTLLNLGGYNPGGLDGIIGGKTLGALDRFTEKTGLLSKTKPQVPKPAETPEERPAKRPAQSFADAAKSGDINITHRGYTQDYEGDNGYGVSNLDIERAWSPITNDAIPEQYKNVPAHEHRIIAENARPLIVIDLGHGSDIRYKGKGKNNHTLDPGAISKDGLTEVEFVDAAGQELAQQLYQRGYQVAFTRNVGEQLRVPGSHTKTLDVRPDFAHNLAKQTGANGVLFISMHANSFAGKAHGARIYTDIDGVNKVEKNADALAHSIASEFKLRSRDTTVKHVGDHRITDRFERGITNGDNMSAAILIEPGFLSDKQDTEAMRKIVENPEEKMGDIARGIDNYVQGTLAANRLQVAENQPSSSITPDAPTS